MTIDRETFVREATRALKSLDAELGDLDPDALDVVLSGDVLTLNFADGSSFIVNAHSAAGQVWLAAGRTAWHFDWHADRGEWIAARQNDELMTTLRRVVHAKLGKDEPTAAS